MTLDSLLARGRAAAEALMTDACTVTRSGGLVFDEEAGDDVETSETVYEGACRVQMTDSLDVSTSDFGGRAVNVTRVTVSLPMDANPPAPQDVVVITAATHDPQLVGERFVVKDYVGKSHATARRVECEHDS